MKNCYVSNYLNIISLKNTSLLFNGFSGSVDEVSKDLGDFLKNNKRIKKQNAILEEEINFLMNRGHLTSLSKEQEIEKFKEFAKRVDDYNMKVYAKRGKLMLLLTYDCNLDCYYCYQNSIRKEKNNKLMTKDLVNQLFNDYYYQLFRDVDKGNVDIILYGGEPLLKKNREVVERALEYSKKYSSNVAAISNCTELEHYIDLLGPLPGMINFIQVSIDGDRKSHNETRSTKKGRFTFDTILRNIHIMLDKKVKVNIRINIQPKNFQNLDVLYDLLEQEEILDHPYSYVYVNNLRNNFGQVRNIDFENDKKVLELLEKMNTKDKIKHPIRRRADEVSYTIKTKKNMPFKKTRFCMKNIPNNYIVDPYGDIYGCYEEAGRSKLKIGSLRNGELKKTLNKEIYLQRNIINIKKCLGCSVALLCGGECDVKVREKNIDIKSYCNSRKKEIHQGIKNFYTKGGDFTTDYLNTLFPNL